MTGRILFAIVLAAGRARRYGATKQLALFRGEALVLRALRAAEEVCGTHSLLVTGSDGAAVCQAASPLAGFRVHNSEFESGLASSIGAGVAAVSHCADAVLLTLTDQPLIDATHLRKLVKTWAAGPDSIVATAYAGGTGVPAVFPRSHFDALRALTGDTGAQRLLQQLGATLKAVPCEAAALDVDTPEDLAAADPSRR